MCYCNRAFLMEITLLFLIAGILPFFFNLYFLSVIKAAGAQKLPLSIVFL